MSLNCNEINLILSELNLEGAFIQEIIQPGYDTLALYTYKEGQAKTVIICTAQNSVRINETRRKITKNDKPLRFMEFLRAKIKGCRINSCKQIGLERVIKMELSHSEDEFFNLYIRLWNNAANVILCDQNDLVLDSMFRRPEKYEMKDETFIPPAVIKDKLADSERFPIREWKKDRDASGQAETDGHEAEGTGAGTHTPPAVGLDTAFGLLDQQGQHCDQRANAVTSGGLDTTSGLLDQRGQHFDQQVFTSFNAYIDWWYSEHADSLSRESLLEKAEKWYNTSLSKRQAALQNLLDKQKSFENAPKLKHQGDLILSYGHLINPDSKFLECEDYESGQTVRLLIDPKKSAQENAAEYYKNYKKALSGAEELTLDIETEKKQIEKLNRLYEEIKKEENPVKIEQLLRRDSTPKQKIKKNHPGLDYIVDGWLIYVGRDANENDELLRHHVRGEDLWLHVRDFPGGYVFIKAKKGKTVPLEILLDAGNLAVYYSKARNAGTVDLYYTHVKYLRRAKNGPKGLVIPTQEKNLCIKTDKARLARLDSIRKEMED